MTQVQSFPSPSGQLVNNHIINGITPLHVQFCTSEIHTLYCLSMTLPS
jgi:hypothetical protein